MYGPQSSQEIADIPTLPTANASRYDKKHQYEDDRRIYPQNESCMKKVINMNQKMLVVESEYKMNSIIHFRPTFASCSNTIACLTDSIIPCHMNQQQ